MIKRYEFAYRSTMTTRLASHFATDEDGNKRFISGDMVELGVTYTYDEETNVRTKVSDYLVDILWTIEDVPEYSQEVLPRTPNHTFAGIDESIL